MITIGLLACLTLLFACSKDDSLNVARGTGILYVDSDDVKFPADIHVFLIGLDGWGGFSMPKADMPNVKSLMRSGAYTFKKRSVFPTSSGPNWASMFMGVSVEQHGYNRWNSTVPAFPSQYLGPNGICPTIFTILREQKPETKTGYFYEWEGMKYYADIEAISKYAHFPLYKQAPNNDLITNEFCNYIMQDKPQFCAVIYDEPDYTGHQNGFNSDAYYNECCKMDGYVGKIIQVIRDSGLQENSIIIVTSDHGGINKNHGGTTLEEMESPFVICGTNVKPLGEFTYSMMQYDIAAIIAYIFKLRKPQSWIGQNCEWLFE